MCPVIAPPPSPTFLRVISWRQELRKWDDVARRRRAGWISYMCAGVTTVFVSVNTADYYIRPSPSFLLLFRLFHTLLEVSVLEELLQPLSTEISPQNSCLLASSSCIRYFQHHLSSPEFLRRCSRRFFRLARPTPSFTATSRRHGKRVWELYFCCG